MEINRYIDHVSLKTEASSKEITKLCEEARKYNFKAVAVNSAWTDLAVELLKGTDVIVAPTIGFPLGAQASEVKAAEGKYAKEHGGKEVDMVVNVGKVKDGDYEYTVKDIKAVVDACNPVPVKVILETCLLSDEEKIMVCKAAVDAGAYMVKTSTGFNAAGATIEDIKLMKKAVEGKCLVKASGGIRTYEQAMALIEAGADRLGCSCGVMLVEEERKHR